MTTLDLTAPELESLRYYLKNIREGEDGGIDTLREKLDELEDLRDPEYGDYGVLMPGTVPVPASERKGPAGMSPITDVLGYVQIDNDSGAYTYWCIDCTPVALRETHREVYDTEAEDNEAVCDGCGWVLADGAVPASSDFHSREEAE